MYDVSAICFMCLCNNSSIKNLFQNDLENETVNQVTYVLPEITSEADIPANICTTCITKLQTLYEFKKRCLDNYSHLKCYIKTTKSTQGTVNQETKQDQKSVEISTEPIIKNEEIDIDLNINQETNDPFMTVEVLGDQNSTNDSIDIKEEFISYPNNNRENYQPFQFVKCEPPDEPNLASENENQPQRNPKKVPFNINFFGDWMQYTSLQTGGKEFKCLICDKEFTAKHILKSHMKLHTGIKEFECTLCYKRFSRNSHLKDHMKLHDGIKDFECTVCNKKFSQKTHLKNHLRIHTGTKEFECSVCHKKFTLKCTLTYHMKVHALIKKNSDHR